MIAILIQKMVAPKLVKKLPEGKKGMADEMIYKVEASLIPL